MDGGVVIWNLNKLFLSLMQERLFLLTPHTLSVDHFLTVVNLWTNVFGFASFVGFVNLLVVLIC